MVKQPKSPKLRNKNEKQQDKHWTHRVHESIVSSGPDGNLAISVKGGADNGQFCYLGEIKQVNYHNGKLHPDEIILEVHGQKVAGYTQRDLMNWVKQMSHNGAPVMFKTVKQGLLTKDLRTYLNTRFAKSSVDHDLQQTIRDNLYLRTVPCTTRPARSGEINGVDYTFLTVDEFMALEKNGNLLESGLYEGNHYGTPKPPREPNSNPLFRRSNSASTLLPGPHPSSEGKRKRNRSNVETMPTIQKPLQQTYAADDSTLPTLTRKRSLERSQSKQDHHDLGTLPSNWEMAFTPDGNPYFIDHNTETTHWLDPRLANAKKSNPDECNVDELPFGWEKVEDPHYGTYYIDHVNRKTQYENPVVQAKKSKSEPNSPVTDRPTLPIHFPISADTDSGISSQKKENGSDDRVPTPNMSPREPLTPQAELPSPNSDDDQKRPYFTKNPAELKGEFIRTHLTKSARGFGFTIIGGDDNDEEFLQIKNVVPNGPAYADGRLYTGDILVHVNDTCVLGYTHQDVVGMFQTIPIGQRVMMEVCRGYSLPFDVNDPNTEIVTTVAVTMPTTLTSNTLSLSGRENLNQSKRSIRSDIVNSSVSSMDNVPLNNRDLPDVLNLYPNGKQPEVFTINIVKGTMGFGFTIADSAYGQKVKQILDKPRCKTLQEGDILVEINHVQVKDMNHAEVVQVLKNCPRGQETGVIIQRGGMLTPNRARKAMKSSRQTEDANREQVPDGPKPHGGVPSAFFYSPDSSMASNHEKLVGAKESNNNKDNKQDLNESLSTINNQRLTPELTSDRSRTPTQFKELDSPRLRNQQGPLNTNIHSTQGELQNTDMNRSRVLPNGYAGQVPFDMTSAHSRDVNAGNFGRVGPTNTSSNHQNGFSGYRPDVDSTRQDYARYNFSGRGPEMERNTMNRPSSEPRREYRSRTPGPEMGRHVPDHDVHLRHRSKTPNPSDMRNERNKQFEHHNISGTPDFIPASLLIGGGPLNQQQRADHHDLQTRSRTDLQSVRPGANYMDHNKVNPTVPPHSPHSPNYPPRSYESYGDLSRSRSGPYGSAHSAGSGSPRKQGSFENEQHIIKAPHDRFNQQHRGQHSPQGPPGGPPVPNNHSPAPRSPGYDDGKFIDMTVHLKRHESGFGFRIIGGTEEGSQVAIGHIVPGGAADMDGRLRSNDEILSVDGILVVNSSHHNVVQLMGRAGFNGRVTLGIRRRLEGTIPEGAPMREPIPGAPVREPPPTQHRDTVYPYDVTVSRRESEGFGFVIISSITKIGSTIGGRFNKFIGRIIEGSPAERCGLLHIGDRILAVNSIDIMTMHHEDIVNIIKDSGYSVRLTVGPPQDDSTSTSGSHKGSREGSMVSAMASPAIIETDTMRRQMEARQSHNNSMFQKDESFGPPMHNVSYPGQAHHRDIPRQRTQGHVPQQGPHEDQDLYLNIELHRGSRGFGFSIRGGQEFNFMPLYILRIAEGGAADLDSRVQVGDQILEINSTPTEGMTHAEAINLIQSGGSKVRLLLKRTGKMPPNFEHQSSPAASGSYPVKSQVNMMTNGPLSHSSPQVGRRPSPDRRDDYMYNYPDPRQQLPTY